MIRLHALSLGTSIVLAAGLAACGDDSTSTTGLTLICEPAAHELCECGTNPDAGNEPIRGRRTCSYNGTQWSECARCGVNFNTASGTVVSSSAMSSGGGGSSSGGSSSRRSSSVGGSGSSGVRSSSHGASSGGSSSGSASTASSLEAESSSVMTESSSEIPACPTPVEEDPCLGVPADGVDRLVNTAGPAPLGVAGLITLGMTRAEVVAAAGADPEVVVDTLDFETDPLRTIFCGLRMEVSYADVGDAMNNVPGSLSDEDVVHRITFRPGFEGHTNSMVRIGSLKTTLDVAYPLDPQNRVETGQVVNGGPWVIYPVLGLSFRHGKSPQGTSIIRSFTVNTGTSGNAQPNSMAGTMNLNTFKISTTQTAWQVAAATLTGSQFGYVATVLGPPTMQGFTSFGGADVAFMSYPNLGIRMLGRPNPLVALTSQKTHQIHLMPPFAGRDSPLSRNLGLGSSQTEFDSQTNITYFSDETVGEIVLRVYRIGPSGYIAVHFAQDECGETRADYIILNHIRQ